MNIYRISQNVNNTYDTYDSAVVIAKDEESARRMHPNGKILDDAFFAEQRKYLSDYGRIPCNDWVTKLEDVKVELIGTQSLWFGLKEASVIVASFNAG